MFIYIYIHIYIYIIYIYIYINILHIYIHILLHYPSSVHQWSPPFQVLPTDSESADRRGSPWDHTSAGTWHATHAVEEGDACPSWCGGSMGRYVEKGHPRSSRQWKSSVSYDIAIDNGHRNSEFSHWKRWFSIVYQRVWHIWPVFKAIATAIAMTSFGGFSLFQFQSDFDFHLTSVEQLDFTWPWFSCHRITPLRCPPLFWSIGGMSICWLLANQIPCGISSWVYFMMFLNVFAFPFSQWKIHRLGNLYIYIRN